LGRTTGSEPAAPTFGKVIPNVPTCPDSYLVRPIYAGQHHEGGTARALQNKVGRVDRHLNVTGIGRRELVNTVAISFRMIRTPWARVVWGPRFASTPERPSGGSDSARSAEGRAEPSSLPRSLSPYRYRTSLALEPSRIHAGRPRRRAGTRVSSRTGPFVGASSVAAWCLPCSCSVRRAGGQPTHGQSRVVGQASEGRDATRLVAEHRHGSTLAAGAVPPVVDSHFQPGTRPACSTHLCISGPCASSRVLTLT
jgi:hypothetical protein